MNADPRGLICMRMVVNDVRPPDNEKFYLCFGECCSEYLNCRAELATSEWKIKNIESGGFPFPSERSEDWG